MEPYQVDNLIELIRAVILIGTGTGAAVALMYTWSKLRGALPRGGDPKLNESLEMVHQALEDLRADLAGQQRELHDRVEFAERLLSKDPSDRD